MVCRYDLLADSFYGQGTFEISLFNELKQNLSAAGINWTDAYTGTQDNSASSDDRHALPKILKHALFQIS